MSAELLRRAARAIRDDMVRSREFYASEDALNRIKASEQVADWLEAVVAATEPEPGRSITVVDERYALAVARAYLGETS